jgi:hypothetical protein
MPLMVATLPPQLPAVVTAVQRNFSCQQYDGKESEVTS